MLIYLFIFIDLDFLKIADAFVKQATCRCNVPTFVAASESVLAVVDGELPHSLVKESKKINK